LVEFLSIIYFGTQTFRYARNYKHLAEPYTMITLLILGLGGLLRMAYSITYLILLIYSAFLIDLGKITRKDLQVVHTLAVTEIDLFAASNFVKNIALVVYLGRWLFLVAGMK
jgi:hypothetical protein